MKTNILKVQDAVEKVVKEYRVNNGIFNPVIREDVFKVLDNSCYTVYYPLEDENINGFHIKRTVCGKEEHFVYINTSNTTERQIFTAAHELGHILNVYEQVKVLLPEIDECIPEFYPGTPEEFVVNKFAAELLMPAHIFIEETNKKLKDLNYDDKNKTINKFDFLRLTISLMNTFFVGYKATTKRFYELARISEETYKIVQTYEDEESFGDIFNKIIEEENYKRLNKRDYSKRITNLTEKIRKAESCGSSLNNTIAKLKETFDIDSTDLPIQDNKVNF